MLNVSLKTSHLFSYTSRHSEYAASLNVEYKIVLDTKDGKENKKARVRFSSPRGSSVKTETTRIARSGKCGHFNYFM